MVVREPARVHEHPPLLRVRDGAVVPDEPAPAALEVRPGVVQGDVDGVGGGVVVRTEEGLLVRTVADHEVHDGARGLRVASQWDSG